MNLCSLDLWPLCYLINRIIIIHILSLPERARKLLPKKFDKLKGKSRKIILKQMFKCASTDFKLREWAINSGAGRSLCWAGVKKHMDFVDLATSSHNMLPCII